MTDKIHDEINDLLAAYEQDLLSSEEAARVESHLYECDPCFQEAASLSDVAALIRNSTAVHDAVAELAGSTDVSSSSTSAPSSRTGYFKYLLAAVLILAVTIPSYIIFGPGRSPSPDQKIILLPVRSVNQQVVDLSIGGTVEIDFASEEFATLGAADVRLLSKELDTLFVQGDYKDFTPTGMGSIIVATDILSPGRIQLEVSEHGAASPLRVYYFMVK